MHGFLSASCWALLVLIDIILRPNQVLVGSVLGFHDVFWFDILLLLEFSYLAGGWLMFSFQGFVD